jgi:phosphate transport system permease protein
MTSVLDRGAPPEARDDVPIDLQRARTGPDRFFRGILLACSSVVLAIIGGITLYLFLRSGAAWHHQGLGFFTSDTWAPESRPAHFGVLGMLSGSVVIAVEALVLALPVALATGLAINEYAPLRLRRAMTALVDLLAALPSLVYGLWGVFFVQPHIDGLTRWLAAHASFIPIFRDDTGLFGSSLFICGVVVAVMILPIIASVSREIMSQVPREQCEAALALGGTRWGMVTDVILPFARNGIVGGALLGLGRAMGETIAVTLIISSNNRLTSHILQPGGGAIASVIAVEFTQGGDLQKSALVLAGLTLFATTLVVNLGARSVVNRAGAAR